MNGTTKNFAGSIQTLRKAAVIGASAAAFMMLAVPAQADLITNGGFETTTAGNGQLGFNTFATGWSSTAYNFVFAPGTADTTGATGIDGGLSLWGTGNGGVDALVVSPNGGNFVAADPVYDSGPITQTINGLTVGDVYALSFYYGGAQQYTFNGPTTEGWDVSLGSQTQDTPVLSNGNHEFTGWYSETFDYTATSSSELLSFMAVGSPPGLPPFAVLDGVSLNPTPEPGTLPLLFTGLMSGLTVLRSKKWLKR